MYMKLLEQTVRELKGEEIEDDVRATVNLRVDLRIDETYVPDMNQRLMLYRKVAGGADARTRSTACSRRPRDRYGPLPDSVLNLADYGRIRVMADRLGIESIDREGQLVVLKFRPQAKLDPAWLFRWSRSARTSDADSAGDAEAGSRTPSGRQAAQRPPHRRAAKSGPDPVAGASWWTARAHGRRGHRRVHARTRSSGRPRRIPRAEGGVFEPGLGLLRDLSDGCSNRVRYWFKI